MDKEEQLAILREVSILQFISEEELSVLFDSGQTLHFAPGDPVFQEGDPGDSMYVVLGGQIEIFKENKQIAMRSRGEFIGEMAMIEKKPRSAGARALLDTYLFRIAQQEFDLYLGSKPEIIKEILRTISGRMRIDLDIIDTGYLELARSEERYRTIVETMSDLVFQLDEEGRIVFANSAVAFMGYDPAELMGVHIRELVAEGQDPAKMESLTTMRVGPRATYNMELRLKVKEDSPLSYIYDECVFLLDAHGLWNVKKELVIKKIPNKRHVGTLIIGRDITQRKQQEMDLKRNRDELETLVQKRTANLERALERTERAQEALSILISRLGHELRTPLNAVIGFAQLMETGDTPLGKDQKDYLEKIMSSGRQLTLLVDQMLKLAEIESGHYAGYPRHVSLSAGINEIARARLTEMRKGDLSLEVELPEQFNAEYFVDMLHLKRVLDQLIANAIRFNKPGGSIRVTGRGLDPQRIELSVEDTGLGMTPEVQARLFESVEAETGQPRREGFGFGLPLIKRLLEAVGGDIQVTSTPGQGSRFTFTFPVDVPQRPPE